MRDTRPISWIKAARKDFEDFPHDAQLEIRRALTLVAEGGWPDIAKPLKGSGSGVIIGAASSRRCFSCRVCLAYRQRYLGDSRVSEKVQDGDQDALGRN